MLEGNGKGVRQIYGGSGGALSGIFDDIYTACPRHIHAFPDELDSDQSVLWIELFRFCKSDARRCSKILSDAR